jgi:hypothetical protein
VFVWFDPGVYRVAVLRLFGWKCWFNGLSPECGVCPIRESAVPARLRLSACATSGPAHRASSIAVPSVAHFYERLGSMRRVHSLTHQRMITRNFQLIIVQTSKGHPIPNPSRPVRSSLAPCGKLVCLSGDRRRTPTHWHAKRCRTAPYECEGCHASAPALQNFLSKYHAQRQGMVIAA